MFARETAQGRRRYPDCPSNADMKVLSDSGLFDPDWYVKRYPDVRALGIDPAEHYLRFGFRMRRDPSPRFDTTAYLASNLDVAAAGLNPLLHYIRFGCREGRIFAAVVGGTGPDACREVHHHGCDTAQAYGCSPTATSSPCPTTLLNKLSECEGLPLRHIPAELITYAQSVLAARPLQVSVIMPTWNRVAVIGSAIESALAQSYRPSEIIISDDGSTDDTLAAIRRVFRSAVESGQIKILENPHRGVSAARNAALRAATGALIAYLDSDNVWHEHFLLLLAAAFAEEEEVMTAYTALHISDQDRGREDVLAPAYDRARLLDWNYIDLNIFAHRRELYIQYGGFDESLSRGVDWDLIIRYTREHPPAVLPFVGAQYYLNRVTLGNISCTVPLDENREKVLQRNFLERLHHGLETVRLAYFVEEFPASPQSFVARELNWLITNGFDVKVYHAVDADRKPDSGFRVEAAKVSGAEELALRLKRDERTLCHSHFAHPRAVAFVWPACKLAGVPHTFLPYGGYIS